MTPQDPSRDDARLADLLATLDATAAAPDEATLARLRAETGAVFSTPEPSKEIIPAPPSRTVWRRKMFRYGLPAAAAALVLVGLAVISWLRPVTGPTLGEVFARVENLDSFEALYTARHQQGTFAFVQPAMLRFEPFDDAGFVNLGQRLPKNAAEASQLQMKYTLEIDGQRWQVDEAQNRVSPEKNRWIRSNHLSLGAVLQVPDDLDLNQLFPLEAVQSGAEQVLTYQLGRPTLHLEITKDVHQFPRRIRVIDLVPGQGNRELVFSSISVPLPASRFQLKDTLTEDGRVGQVVDIQGVVSVRAVGRDRWTPLAVSDLLKPGDLVRSNPRGPNAARVRLAPNTDITFGPGATLEIKTPIELRLLAGEIEVHPRGRKIEVASAGKEAVTVEEKTILRTTDEKLVKLTEEPAWLKGFKGAVANESLGSLLANVDGRNVPLNVGYHKVDVDIRDGLARTTIEESFVNTTNQELEGTFFFPLPADASIAGFGMWIGNELVEADVVEKQRAREIFDIILSEKKDPGLLEWSGGNLFKTRVYPIPARGEKRIKIIYTQTLPLEGQRFRYSYALLSDLLKQHPLRELSLTINVSSAWPLAKVFSPTHPVREEKAGGAARLVFTAQEYTPSRDFEAVIELASKPAPVTLSPHRRGDDGYFLLRISPPSGSGAWERDLVRDGSPLHLLLLCDTSASIDKHQREQQAAFVTALLGSLSVKDTFNLACADVETDWVFSQAMPAEAKHAAAAQAMLQARKSLGWTDLEKALASAMNQAGPNTHVIYLGDGTPAMSLGHDPKVFVDRFKTILGRGKGYVHAVALGSTHESMVLRAMASLSGGSWRKIAADRGPAQQARDLLLEVTDPSLLRDLSVAFEGVKVARVYPETLPNLRAGTELVLTGRYLPQQPPSRGKIILTGRMGDQVVRFTQDVVLPEGDAGNSFIPRLWARQHIEHLIETGGAASREEIITRAEEFHLMTPYTSFLVLENDAMRERFAVKRRFGMRDGERFFADGRSQTQLLLRQKQMRLAADWRVGLRRQVLEQLERLGRLDPSLLPQLTLMDGREWVTEHMNEKYDKRLAGRSLILGDELFDSQQAAANFALGRSGGLEGGYGLGGGGIGGGGLEATGELPAGAPGTLEWGRGFGPPILGTTPYVNRLFDDVEDQEGLIGLAKGKKELGLDYDAMSTLGNAQLGSSLALDYSRRSDDKFGVVLGLTSNGRFTNNLDIPISSDSFAQARVGTMSAQTRGFGYGGRRPYYSYPQPQPLGLQRIFPTIAPVALPFAKAKPPVWSPDIVEIIRQIDRRPSLQKLKETNLILDRVQESYDLNRNQLASQSKRVEYVADQKWLTRQEADGTATLIDWCDAQERGVLNLAFATGRVRPSTGPERQQPPLALADHSMEDLPAAYGQVEAKLERLQGAGVHITLLYPDKKTELRWEIDTVRHVLLKEEHYQDKKLASFTTFADFQNVAGLWWAGRISYYDARGMLSGQTIQQVQSVGAELLQRRWDKELRERPNCLILPQPLPSVESAKQGVAGGKGSVTDHIVLMAYFTLSQQWSRVNEHLTQVERLAAGKLAPRWLRTLVLYVSRDHEAMRQQVVRETDNLVKQPRPRPGDDWALAGFLQEYAVSVSSPHEALAFLAKVQPVCQRQPGHRRAMRGHQLHRANHLDQANRGEEARAIYKQLAESDLFDYSAQWLYFTKLIDVEELDAARDWLFRLLRADRDVLRGSQDQFWNHLLQHFKAKGRYRDLFALASTWIKRDPAAENANLWYLAGLVWTDQQEELDRTLQLWIMEGPGRPESAQAARFRTAYNTIRHANYALQEYQPEVPERYHGLLLGAAEKLIGDPRQAQFVAEVLSSAAGGSAAGMKIRRGLVARLNEEAPTLPRERLGALVTLALHHATWVADAEHKEQDRLWENILTTLRRRWKQAQQKQEKYSWGGLVASVLAQRNGPAAHLAFLRERLRAEHPDYRLEHLNGIYHALQSLGWSPEGETELLALLPQLDDPAVPDPVRLYSQVHRLQQLVDYLQSQRQAKLWNEVKDKEKLTRLQQTEKQREAANTARTALAVRLQQEAARGGPLAVWLTAEQLYLRTQTGAQLPEIAAEAWKALDALPAPAKRGERPKFETNEQWQQVRLIAIASAMNEILRDRHVSLLAYLATKKSAQPVVVDRLIAYLEKQQKERPDEPRWQQHLVQLLIALDRPQDLESHLRKWLESAGANQHWRIVLAYLQAERGGLDEAVKLLEKVKEEDELRPADWRALSDWYLALDQKDRSLDARSRRFEMMPEQLLWQWLQLQQQLVSRQSGGTPSELDEDVFRVVPILFRKSTAPANYTYIVQTLYQTTRDFRLLSGLAEGVIGHTPGRVYPFLRGWAGVLGEIRDEATVDELSKHLQEVRQRAKTAVDRRALDLLEMLVHRRAAELLNQAGPHAERAVAALDRAMQHEWTVGEPGEMAELLSSLGRIAAPAVAERQLRGFSRLQEMTQPGTPLRERVALHHARTLRAYDQREQAVRLLQASIEATRSKDARRLIPTFAQASVDELLNGLRGDGRYDEAERFLNQELARPYGVRPRDWWKSHLFDTYLGALAAGKTLSLGGGEALFRAVEASLFKEAAPDRSPDYRVGIFSRLNQLYRSAHDLKLPGVPAACRRAVFERYPPLLASLYQHRLQITGGTIETLRIVLGHNEAVAFLLDEYDRAPASTRRGHVDLWQQFQGYFASYRQHVNDQAVLDRLQRLVLERLTSYLTGRRNDGTEMFIKNSQWYWQEKEETFATTAVAMYTARQPSIELAQRVAGYLRSGLQRPLQAAELLRLADRQHVLNEERRYLLVGCLIDASRHAEAIPELQRLIAEHPMFRYHLRLMGCYFHAQREADLRATLAATEKRFAPQGKWSTGDLERVAKTAYEVHLFANAMRLYEILIPQYRQERKDQGYEQDRLWDIYRHAALSYVEVNETAKAMDAISSAVVLWGRSFQDREDVLNSLRTAMRRSKDPQTVIRYLDEEAKRNQGRENPMLRRVLAQVLIERGQNGLAAMQLRLVLDLKPDDLAAFGLLLQALDHLGQRAEAATAAYQLAEVKRRDAQAWKDLGRRYDDLGEKRQAERAYTSMVEMLPNEAEGHSALAQVRESQNRWEEAITHWKLAIQYKSEDPAGLLGLINLQLNRKQWDEARKTLEQLRKPPKPWHQRFNNLQIPTKITTFEQLIQEGRTKR